jgi:hypothetical protein
MRSPCAGAALDPPLWIIPNKALSLSLSLSLWQADVSHADLSLSRVYYDVISLFLSLSLFVCVRVYVDVCVYSAVNYLGLPY